MKKRFLTLLSLVFSAVFLLSGCSGLVSRTNSPLKVVPTNMLLWEFYQQVESNKSNLFFDLSASKNKNLKGYDELYNMLDNQEELSEILRDSMVAASLFYDESPSNSDISFLYDNYSAYTAKKMQQLRNYEISYGKNIMSNKSVSGDVIVDSILERLIIPINVAAKVVPQAMPSGSVNSIFSVELTYTVSNPVNAAEIQAFVPSSTTDINGFVTEYGFTLVSDTENKFEAKAEKNLKNSDGYILSTYSKTAIIERLGTAKILRVIINNTGLDPIEKTYTLSKKIIGTSIGIDKSKGKLEWTINHPQGQATYMGEAFFQGNKKFLVKEKLGLKATSAYNYSTSFTTEFAVEGDDAYKFKYAPGEIEFTSIATQNIIKFGSYDKEVQAIVFERVGVSTNLAKYG